MPTCVEEFCKAIVALAAVAALALVNMGAAPAVPALPFRLEQHALMLAAAARSSSAAEAPQLAARYIETALASQGHAVSRRDYTQQGHPMHNIEVTLSSPASTPAYARVLVVGASYASGARNNETAAVIELARLLKGLRPAEGTELKFVFFVSGAPPGQSRHARRLPDTGNFIAFAGTRGSAALVRKTLASFRAASDFPGTGLAAPAYVEGVTLLGHAARRCRGDPALMITDITVLHYPYSHTVQGTQGPSDYASMARSVDNLAKLIAGMAAPASM